MLFKVLLPQRYIFYSILANFKSVILQGFCKKGCCLAVSAVTCPYP